MSTAKKKADGIRVLSNGRISVRIHEISHMMLEALLSRIIEEENEVLRALLLEVKSKIDSTPGKRVSMRKSEFLCLFSDDVIAQLDDYEKAYLIAVINPARAISIALP